VNASALFAVYSGRAARTGFPLCTNTALVAALPTQSAPVKVKVQQLRIGSLFVTEVLESFSTTSKTDFGSHTIVILWVYDTDQAVCFFLNYYFVCVLVPQTSSPKYHTNRKLSGVMSRERYGRKPRLKPFHQVFYSRLAFNVQRYAQL
jgi:hypothetical protein